MRFPIVGHGSEALAELVYALLKVGATFSTVLREDGGWTLTLTGGF
jgi:hypothetical protein